MPWFTKITLIIATLWFGMACRFAYRQSVSLQFLLLPVTLILILVALLGLIRIFTHWKSENWRPLIPPFSCFFVVALFLTSRTSIQNFAFKQSLPHFESIIRQLESAPLPDSDELLRIARAQDKTIYHVNARRSEEGTLSVEFLTGGGFPVKHTGYLYTSSGRIEAGSLWDSRWPKRRELQSRWLRVSD